MLLTMTSWYAAHAATCISAAGTNNWSVVATWSCGHVPAVGDDVVIANGSTTTLDVASNTLASLSIDGALVVGANLNVNGSAASSLTISSSGTMTVGNSATARAVIVGGDINVSGAFTLGATAATHTLTVGGNFNNTGNVNFAPGGNRICNVTFNKNGNQVINGNGTYIFNRITLNMGASNANVLDVQSAITVPSGFLIITNGTYKHSSPSNISPWAANPNIPASGGFWLNSAATVTTIGFNVNVSGLFRLSAGIVNIGNANNTVLILGNAATTLLQIDGGNLNVSGGINSATNTSAGTFTVSGGTITLQTVSAGPVYSLLLGSATTFNMSGGTIVAKIGNSATDDVDIRSATQNITGGTLQFGNATTSGANPLSLINSTGGQLNVWNLTLASGIAKSVLLRSSINVLNDLNIQTSNTLDSSGGNFSINVGGGNASGNWTNNGNFLPGTGTVSFLGNGPTQTIGGTTATTFNNLAINKSANNLTVSTSPTVNTRLTFGNGKILTAANRIILGANATLATPSATSYVVGTMQKNYNANANLNFFAGNDFPIGSATSFTPIDITAGTTRTAGNLTVSTTSAEHPQVSTPIPSTVIDVNKDVARYWTLRNSGLTVGTAISATFTFVATDLDAGANFRNFIVQRYDGTSWNGTTLVAANTLNTQISNVTTLTAGNNDFAIGEPLSGLSSPGRFNAFETLTAANALLGQIHTKVAGVAFSLDIISLNAAKTAYGGAAANITVALLDSSNNSGALDVNGCRPTWTIVQTLTTGLNIPISGRVTLGGMRVPQIYQNARLRMSTGSGLIGCSTDNFAIRPSGITLNVSDNDSTTAGLLRTLNNTATIGGRVHRAGQPFTVRAAASPATATNYAGNPTVKTVSCVLPVGCNNGTFTLNTFSGTGTRRTTAIYSEAGTFNLELEDATFANVDLADSSTAERVIPQLGGPTIVGRFVPDHFVLAAASTPQFKTFNNTTCSPRSFTYIGQRFGYVTAPLVGITAQNVGGITTTNYKGALWKLTASNISQAYTSTQVLDTSLLGLPIVASNNNGTGSVTANPSDVLAFNRNLTTPQAPFTANISLTISAVDTSENSVIGNGSIATTAAVNFNSIAFDAGALFRFGRLKLGNAHGSELLDLPINLETQYYNGTTFVTNTEDNCTSIPASAIVTGNFQKNLAPCETSLSLSGNFIAGKSNLKLTKPGSGNSGSVDLSAHLEPTASGSTCIAGAAQAATAADQSYLQGAWTTTTYDQDPSARATFGIYKNASKFIYMRENF